MPSCGGVSVGDHNLPTVLNKISDGFRCFVTAVFCSGRFVPEASVVIQSAKTSLFFAISDPSFLFHPPISLGQICLKWEPRISFLRGSVKSSLLLCIFRYFTIFLSDYGRKTQSFVMGLRWKFVTVHRQGIFRTENFAWS